MFLFQFELSINVKPKENENQDELYCDQDVAEEAREVVEAVMGVVFA